MKNTAVFLILIQATACTNSTPSVSLLETHFTPKSVQTVEYADANVAGAKQVSTTDNFVGRFVVHSGTETKTAETADHYRLTIRKVAF